jgi:hypothetical protein
VLGSNFKTLTSTPSISLDAIGSVHHETNRGLKRKFMDRQTSSATQASERPFRDFL